MPSSCFFLMVVESNASKDVMILLSFKFAKIVSTVVSNRPAVEVETPKSKPSHIDVEMKKNISLQKAKVSSVKSDEVIKGKVSTQKDKLKQLRRG